MDFFRYQQDARRRVGLLLFYFMLAVGGIILAVYLAVLMLLGGESFAGFWQVDLFIPVALSVLLIIGLGTLWKTSRMASGGSAVAEMLGGRRIFPEGAGLAEKRLLNVVEEMAIASGTPLPAVYLLDNESGINAFAAGFQPADAAVAVSAGALQHLSREELQAVVAHEFSHIFNGDMRLNIRLIGVLYGILVISTIGRIMLRSISFSGGRRSSRSGKKDGGGGLVLFALALMLIGAIGVFFGRLIKSAVSRQREFLADASAVQFTRNPAGLAGVLKKIGGLRAGSIIKNPHAEEASHLFFANGLGGVFSGLLSSHPPLVDRVKRLEPNFDGRFKPLDSAQATAPDSGPEAVRPGFSRIFKMDPLAVLATIGTISAGHLDYARGLLQSIPEELRTRAGEAHAAQAVVYGLLLDREQGVRERQLNELGRRLEPELWSELGRVQKLLADHPPQWRLPLVDLARTALQQLSPPQKKILLENCEMLAASDQKLSLPEFVVLTLLQRGLLGTQPPAAESRLSDEDFRRDALLLLGALAGQEEDPEKTAAAFRAGWKELAGRREEAPAWSICSMEELGRALARLAASVPAQKMILIKACLACVFSDRRVSVAESELLRAVGEILQVPLPPILPGMESEN